MNFFSKFSAKTHKLIVHKKSRLKKSFDQAPVFHIFKKLHKFHWPPGKDNAKISEQILQIGPL